MATDLQRFCATETRTGALGPAENEDPASNLKLSPPSLLISGFPNHAGLQRDIAGVTSELYCFSTDDERCAGNSLYLQVLSLYPDICLYSICCCANAYPNSTSYIFFHSRMDKDHCAPTSVASAVEVLDSRLR